MFTLTIAAVIVIGATASTIYDYRRGRTHLVGAIGFVILIFSAMASTTLSKIAPESENWEDIFFYLVLFGIVLCVVGWWMKRRNGEADSS